MFVIKHGGSGNLWVKIAPLSMPRGAGAFGDSAPEIETEKYNRTDIELFIME